MPAPGSRTPRGVRWSRLPTSRRSVRRIWRQNAATARSAIYADLATMLAEADIDAVDICLPHHLHTEAILAAARSRQGDPLRETALHDAGRRRRDPRTLLEQSGSVFMAAHNQLFQPSLIEARRLLAAGALGRPFVLPLDRGRAEPRLHQRQRPSELGGGESPWAWRADPQRMGGGEVIDTGWHATYRLLALADDRPVEVTAMMDRFAVKQLDGRGHRGAAGSLRLRRDWRDPHELGVQPGRRLAFRGRRRAWQPGWRQDPAGPPASRLAGAGRVHEITRIDLPHTFTSEITHFLDVVQRGAVVSGLVRPCRSRAAADVGRLHAAAEGTVWSRCQRIRPSRVSQTERRQLVSR